MSSIFSLEGEGEQNKLNHLNISKVKGLAWAMSLPRGSQYCQAPFRPGLWPFISEKKDSHLSNFEGWSRHDTDTTL